VTAAVRRGANCDEEGRFAILSDGKYGFLANYFANYSALSGVLFDDALTERESEYDPAICAAAY
jgi:hypothetical protein